MADVITRFRLETTQYDSKLRDAAKSLAEVSHQAQLGGKSFTDFSKNAIENARSLGTVASGATNLKDKVKDLVGAYNAAANAYNTLTREQQQSDFGKALAQSLTQLKSRITEAKQELYGLGDVMKSAGGGLFGGDKFSGMLQVFGGNLMTKAAGWAAGFATEIGDAVKQGVELARAGEGVRIAFQRLGRGDILDGLREATHGTVTDLELMKAAVKFNDFKLPVEELGTMLAFAQQKAKDTGQSIDYMVDSIVTGLGRKSLMILDNLGLSAAEIKEKMKETGDMTKAVGEIIREQMSKAGDYVETAADRATRADVRLKNSMEDLGNTLMPLTDAGMGLFNQWKVSAIDLLNSAIKPLIQAFTQLGAVQKIQQNMNGGGMMERFANNLKNSKNKDALYSQQLMEINRAINRARTNLQDAEKGGKGSIEIYRNRLQALINIKNEYEQVAKAIMQSEAVIASGGTVTPNGTTTKTNSSKSASVDFQKSFDTAMLKGYKNTESFKAPDLSDQSDAWKAYTGDIRTGLEGINDELTNLTKFTKNFDPHLEFLKEAAKRTEQVAKANELAAQSASNLGSALAGLDDPSARAAGTVIQAIANIALSFSQAATQASSLGSYGWIAYMAAGTAALATTISTIHSLTGYAEGGEIKGNSYSGDRLPIMANAGEVVLTRAMAGNLASQLEGNGGGTIQATGILQGENILIALERVLKRKGYGELATWKN